MNKYMVCLESSQDLDNIVKSLKAMLEADNEIFNEEGALMYVEDLTEIQDHQLTPYMESLRLTLNKLKGAHTS
jgi:hypothetical protein